MFLISACSIECEMFSRITCPLACVIKHNRVNVVYLLTVITQTNNIYNSGHVPLSLSQSMYERFW